MTPCPAFSAEGPVNVADALRSVDCLSGQAVEIAFGRLFGESGALGQALTLVLTLYVALLALSLLTGHTRLRLNMLTPRMLQLGLVLTFATSWVAYQSVGWNLLVSAPDQIASVMLGTHGSATQLFAARLDTLFDVIAQTAHAAQGATAIAPASAAPQIANASPRPSDLLWAASLLLLLGTVGVLIVARIALAAVMALGPVFIVFALFRGTRGLFEGWLKAAVMLAITPMLAVLLGGGTMVLIAPMIAALRRAGGKVTLELATSVFLAAFIYLALMVLAMRAAAMITAGWRLGGGRLNDTERGDGDDAPAPAPPMMPSPALDTGTGDRMRTLLAGLGAAPASAIGGGEAALGATARRTVITQALATGAAPDTPSRRDPRLRPLGQGFRAPARGTP